MIPIQVQLPEEFRIGRPLQDGKFDVVHPRFIASFRGHVRFQDVLLDELGHEIVCFLRPFEGFELVDDDLVTRGTEVGHVEVGYGDGFDFFVGFPGNFEWEGGAFLFAADAIEVVEEFGAGAVRELV